MIVGARDSNKSCVPQQLRKDIRMYNGKPWFLPFAGAYYKFLDWVS